HADLDAFVERGQPSRFCRAHRDAACIPFGSMPLVCLEDTLARQSTKLRFTQSEWIGTQPAAVEPPRQRC
ncbi:MAG: hypothetical protein KJ052_16570, partial [Candidatus Hydrogenedentes bacterium]|nr:hypothetical protein [Candidatus Hydrogenedentota bacterium]